MVACTACLLFACKCSSKSGETASAEKLSAETVWGLQSIRNKKVSFAEEGRMAYQGGYHQENRYRYCMRDHRWHHRLDLRWHCQRRHRRSALPLR